MARPYYWDSDGLESAKLKRIQASETVGKVLTDGDSRSVVIGKDRRVSGYMFESALEAVLAAAGAN